MQVKSVQSVTNLVEKLRVTKGYTKNSTAEWRRLSMQLSHCGLIQFARQLALLLDAQKGFLVGVDEQDFNPKVHILDLNQNQYCVLSVSKHVDDETRDVRYSLGHISDPDPQHSIDVSGAPTDEDFTHALALIESKSWEVTQTQKGSGKTAAKQQSNTTRSDRRR